MKILAPAARALRLSCAGLGVVSGAASADWNFYPGDYSQAEVIGMSMPGTWRPFSDDSPWNTEIGPSPPIHADSSAIMATVVAEAANLRLANTFVPPIWVVNFDNMPALTVKSSDIFDTWDQDGNGKSDVRVPIDETMYAEPTPDGHIIIVDPFHLLSWEMSTYGGISNGLVYCTTFNIWDLKGSGVGETTEGVRWHTRGGRGSGFPIIAGLLRPEEVLAGAVDHALVFTFSLVRDQFVPPATRDDASLLASQYPMEGMLFQLDPALTDADFDSWGLGAHAKVVARALRDYGMYLADKGGAMALQVQLLDSDPAVHRMLWDILLPDLYDDMMKIPSGAFRVVDTGPAISGGGETTAVAPLIKPVAGSKGGSVTMATPTPGAEIRYTTDGSDPVATSTLYTGPFVQTGPATDIRARTFEPSLAPSPVTRAPFVPFTAAVPAFSRSGLACLLAAILAGAASALCGRARGRR